MSGNEKVYKYWSKRSNTHDTVVLYIVGHTINREIENWLINQFNDTDVVLELGCGSGLFSEIIATVVKRLVATDLSGEMIEQANKKLSKFINVETRIEDSYKTSFDDNTFDTVFMANLLHIVKNPVAILMEANRVLKDDGRILTVDYTGYGMSFFKKLALGFRYMKKWHSPAPYSKNLGPDELTEIAQKAGFVTENLKLIGENTKALCWKGGKNNERNNLEK